MSDLHLSSDDLEEALLIAQRKARQWEAARRECGVDVIREEEKLARAVLYLEQLVQRGWDDHSDRVLREIDAERRRWFKGFDVVIGHARSLGGCVDDLFLQRVRQAASGGCSWESIGVFEDEAAALSRTVKEHRRVGDLMVDMDYKTGEVTIGRFGS